MIKHDVEKQLRERGYRFKYFHRRFEGTQVKSLEGYVVEETGENFRILIKWQKNKKGITLKIDSLLVEITTETKHIEYYTLKR